PPCRSRLRLNRGDGRDWALPRRVSRQLGSLGGRGAPRRAHEIIAKPCRGGDLQAVGRLFWFELQDFFAGFGAPAVVSPGAHSSWPPPRHVDRFARGQCIRLLVTSAHAVLRYRPRGVSKTPGSPRRRRRWPVKPPPTGANGRDAGPVDPKGSRV